jgi:hypothetical protein
VKPTLPAGVPFAGGQFSALCEDGQAAQSCPWERHLGCRNGSSRSSRASSTKRPPGKEWLHEIKYDGYRMHARIDGGQATLLTRTGLDWSHRYKR